MRSIVGLLVFLGLPSVAASALAVLITASKPLTLTELSNRTGYAKSHLSTHLRYLARTGLVEYIRKHGRAFYRARKDALLNLIHKHLKELKQHLDYINTEIKDTELSSLLNSLHNELSKIIHNFENNAQQG
ncbi:MAG: helix-turn-helix domain-containing protein [Staphylothermus sp.]|nr:helix-turn-helix domain-containing protein [Staphylothermus sp.]